MNAVKWVLIDETKGATTTDGSKLSAAVLSHIAEAVTSQLNQEFAAEWGAQTAIRVGANANDVDLCVSTSPRRSMWAVSMPVSRM